LERLGVLPGATPKPAAAAKAPAPKAPERKAAATPQAAAAKPAPPRAKPAPATRPPARAVTIDFDDADESTQVPVAAAGAPPAVVEVPAPAPTPAPAPRRAPAPRSTEDPRGRRRPGPDMLQEIEALLEGGDVGEARRRVEALLTLGYEGPPLEDLRARIAGLEAPDAAVQRDVPPAGLLDEDDDLGAITAALESELLASDVAAEAAPQPESEQSLEDVFAAFRQHVATEIEGDDYRTHYDLGIAYKEMDLLDDAIEQFQRVLGSPDLNAEALAMLAVCLRDAGRLDDAANSYRQAIEACRADGDVLHSLRYELAEVLLGSGDPLGALGQFRDVLARDPTFRDVRDRVAQLES
jgi:hypothetical protein